jgi:homocysteine S-methyltransferase
MKTNLNEVQEQKDLIILDGAMATELEGKGLNLNDELWSAKVLTEQPLAIKEVHYDYFKSGADAGISASYQASMNGFLKKGYSENEAKDLIAYSMELLLQARKEWWEKEGREARRVYPLAIGSVGPYGAYLADGSEYSGNYQVSEQTLQDFHINRMEILKEAGAELIALETFPSLYEAVVCAQMMERIGVDYYISFSCRNSNQINDGSSIAECVKALSGLKYLKAIGVNCTQPQFVGGIVDQYKKITNLSIVVYPNSGESFDVEKKIWYGDMKQKTYGDCAKEWYEAGATMIGGCCRTTPKNINEIYTWYNHKK